MCAPFGTIKKNNRDPSDARQCRGLPQQRSSHSHLSRIFQRETGKTVGVYLNELRIDHVCKILQTQSCSITDTAMVVGFSFYAKFSVEFKKHTGVCASDYLHKQNV